jgi:hypothetical protein
VINMPVLTKLMACYFLLGSFLPQSDFSQLAKLGQLVEHYEFHRELATAEGQSFSFLEYLSIHFTHPDEHGHHDNSHQDLPLQSFSVPLQITLESNNWALQMPQQNQLACFAPVQAFFPLLIPLGLLRPPIV